MVTTVLYLRESYATYDARATQISLSKGIIRDL
jgi:hypothetical protein